MKGSSPHRGLEVFDFVEEDELAEQIVRKCPENCKNPSPDNDPILKCKLSECVSQGTNVRTKEISSIPCADVDAIGHDHCSNNANSHSPLGTIEEKLTTEEDHLELDAAPQSKCLSHEEYSDSKLDNHGSRSFLSEPESRCSNATLPFLGKSQLDCALPVSPSSNEPVDVISDADESMSGSPLSRASEIEEDDVSLGTYELGLCSGNMGMNLQDDINMTVVLYPDYVLYRDNYCTEPQLTFSDSCIKISGPTASENHETFNFEWGVDDLVNVECQWFERVEFVMIKLRVISKDAAEDDNVHGTSGIEELKIAVVDPNWFQKQEKIASLNVKYLNAWDVVQNVGADEDDSLGQRRHFPNFDESFEDVVYPKGDSDAVSISKRDVDLLQPETFINDTIIDFYIKYLKNQIPPNEKHRFHFFNSFFFRKLADLDKDPSSVSDGRAAFQRVRKWTRKVDLFEKDYIFIPINFNLHWSLIVICHPGELPRHKDGDPSKSLKVPCILHMDSIKGSHTGLKNLVQSYLWEEWKERKKETSEEISSKFHNLRFVSLELPQQENLFDCGLFLLHYLELFLAEVPVNFNPFEITKFSNFLKENWFPPSEASLKRTLIQRLIFELLENRCREVSSAACSDENRAELPVCNEHETGVGFLSGRCCPAIACQEDISSSQAGQGIEMTLLSTSSLRSSECVNDTGLVLREFFESGTTAGSPFGQYQPFDQKSSFYRLNGAIPPVEEDTETGEHFTYLPTGDSGFQQITGMTSQTCSIPYSSRIYGAETSFDLELSAQAQNGNIDSSPESSICASDDSEDIGIIENYPVGEDLGQSQKEETDGQSCPMENFTFFIDGVVSTSGKMQVASIIGGSQDHEKMHDGNDNGVPLPSCQENTDIEGSQDHDKVHDGNDNGGPLPSCRDTDIEGSQDHDKVHDSNENGGPFSSCRDTDIEGSQDHDKLHDSNDNGGPFPSCRENTDIEGSPDHDKVHDSTDNGGPLPSCQENTDMPTHQDSDMVDNRTVSCDDVQMVDDGMMPESEEEQRAAKRLRLSPPLEGEKCFT